MKASIQAVAAEAGVSISTVSRTFAKPNLVLPETRSKVMAAAEKLDYRISRSAAALKTGQSFRVALLMSDPISTWFNSNTYAGLDSVLHPAGYDISIFEMADAHDRHEFFATLPVRRNVDAVIVNSFNIVPEEVEKLSNMKVPIVGINIPSINGFNATVSIDDRQAMHVAVEHLFSMGHRRIAYAYETSNDNNQNMVFSAEARLHGLMETAEKRKMTVERIAIRNYEDATNTILNSLLTMDPAPTALYCESDELALPVIYKLCQYGHAVPQELSVIGFDDVPPAAKIGLTTLHQDPFNMGDMRQLITETFDGAGVEAGGGERTFHAHLILMCLYFIGNCLQCLEIVDAVNRLNACPGRIEVLLQQLLIVDDAISFHDVGHSTNRIAILQRIVGVLLILVDVGSRHVGIIISPIQKVVVADIEQRRRLGFGQLTLKRLLVGVG